MNKIAAYWQLGKPRVVLLMLITAWVGMLLAPHTDIPWRALTVGSLGIGLVSFAGAALNHLLDRRVDALMARTAKRPLVAGELTEKEAILFSAISGFLGLWILAMFINPMTALLTFGSLVGYAVIYTVVLKRLTPQNIVLGGAAGAMPPVLGWTAVTGTVDPFAYLLFLIVYVWTPPHFWALAVSRAHEYAKANIPMLPVTHGIPYTTLNVLLYAIQLMGVSLLPFIVGMSGKIYCLSALGLGAIFVWLAAQLMRHQNNRMAIRLFHYSIYYLFLLFGALLVDHYWQWNTV